MESILLVFVVKKSKRQRIGQVVWIKKAAISHRTNGRKRNLTGARRCVGTNPSRIQILGLEKGNYVEIAVRICPADSLCWSSFVVLSEFL